MARTAARQRPTQHAESRHAVRLMKRRLQQEPSAASRVRIGNWSPGIKSTWTVADVRAALLQHEQGSFSQTAQLVDAMWRDDRIPVLVEGRARGMLGLPLVCQPPPGHEDDPYAQKLADDWTAWYERVFPLDHQVRALVDLIMFGFALCQVTWERADLGQWEPRVWNEQAGYVYWDEARMGYNYVTRDGTVPIVPGDGRWILFEMGDRGYLRGAVRGLALFWLIRQQAWFDWARWSERHGMPLLLAKYPVQVADDEADEFWDDIRALGRDASVMLPQGVGPNGEGYDLGLLEAKDRGYGGFKDLLDETARAFSIRLLGQNLTTEVDGGSFAAASVHKTVKREVLQGDERGFHLDVRDQLVRPVSEMMVAGGARVAPVVGRDLEPPEDMRAEAETINVLSLGVERLASIGLPIDVAVIAERFSVPLVPGSQVGQPLFGYHLEYGLFTLNQAKARLGLPPVGPEEGGEKPPVSQAVQAQVQAERRRSGAAALPGDIPALGDEAKAATRVAVGALPAPSRKAPDDYQGEVEREGAAAATDEMDPDLEKILKAIDGAEDYDQAKARVLAAFDGMDPDGVAEVMRRALVLAELAGLYDATAEATKEAGKAAPKAKRVRKRKS